MLKTLLITTALLASTVSAMAATCEGQLAMIRTSKIMNMDGFKAAVKAQADWYAAKGFKDKIMMASVMEKDAVSMTSAMTIHYYADNKKAEVTKDAAWDDFVGKFKTSPEITSESLACLPK